MFKLYRLPLKKKLKLYNEGIDTFEKITNTESFSSIQKLQLEAYKKKNSGDNKNKIKAFINKIKYPISYFDFETFTDAIPIFDKQRPHMQIPFQYSLHIQMNEDEKLEIDDNHFEFIAEHEKDPRRSIAESMIKNFPKNGTIMAYNQSFEKRCVQSLAEYCPDLSDELLALNERFIDLIEPFRGGGFYHSKFKGSFSIKNVLPVICPTNSVLDYKALDISNGGMAMSAYKELRNSSNNVDIETTRKNLFKYCRLDTYAMYAIYIKLLQIIK